MQQINIPFAFFGRIAINVASIAGFDFSQFDADSGGVITVYTVGGEINLEGESARAFYAWIKDATDEPRVKPGYINVR